MFPAHKVASIAAVSLLLPLGIASLTACTDKDSSNGPVPEVLDDSTQTEDSQNPVKPDDSQDSATPGDTQDQNTQEPATPENPQDSNQSGDSQEPAQPGEVQQNRPGISITVDEAAQTITYHIPITSGYCTVSANTAKWTAGETFPVKLNYSIENNQLSLVSDDIDDKPQVFNGTSNSIYGIWTSTEFSTTLEITQDKLYSNDLEFSTGDEENVETEINLASSRFLLDFLFCADQPGSNYICNFRHTHLYLEDAERVEYQKQIVNATILNSTDRAMTLSVGGQEFSITVEHVQKEDVNDGIGLFEAAITSLEKTCRYKYSAAEVTEEICNTSNLDGLKFIPTEYDEFSDDGYAQFTHYFNENQEEFQDCVKELLGR